MAAELGIEPGEGAIETSMAHVWLRPDGIMCVVLKPGIRVTVEGSLEVNATMRTLAHPDICRPVLTDISAPHQTDPAVRRYGSSEVTREVTRRLGLVVRTPVSRMLGNAFLLAKRPPFPVRLFTDYGLALDWLGEDAR